jgi:hypothetical protein
MCRRYRACDDMSLSRAEQSGVETASRRVCRAVSRVPLWRRVFELRTLSLCAPLRGSQEYVFAVALEGPVALGLLKACKDLREVQGSFAGEPRGYCCSVPLWGRSVPFRLATLQGEQSMRFMLAVAVGLACGIAASAVLSPVVGFPVAFGVYYALKG